MDTEQEKIYHTFYCERCGDYLSVITSSTTRNYYSHKCFNRDEFANPSEFLKELNKYRAEGFALIEK